MKPEDEIQLEQQISRALKSLPELKAPPTLTRRILARIEAGVELPWYRRSWQSWPAGLQAASFIALLLLFVGLTFGAWQLAQAPSATAALQRTTEWFSSLSVVWNTLHVLASAALIAIQKLGPVVIAVGIALVLFAYLACIGLGTAAFRFAFARR